MLPRVSKPMMKRLLMLVALLAAVTLHGEGTSRPTPDRVVRPFREAAWSTTGSLAALPATLRALVEKTVGVAIAEKGALWNGGCVIEPGLPSRRFVLAGSSGDQTILVYEHGGFVAHQHAVCFARAAGGNPTVIANLEVQGISTAADIPRALAPGRYRSTAHY